MRRVTPETKFGRGRLRVGEVAQVDGLLSYREIAKVLEEFVERGIARWHPRENRLLVTGAALRRVKGA